MLPATYEQNVTEQTNKYDLYERSVQSPEEDLEEYLGLYRQLRGESATPRKLREDFCGTFLFSCAFVKGGAERNALCVDLDPEPLAYGRRVHLPKLKPQERKRLRVLNQNVLNPVTEKADLIVANNSSFYVFKERRMLVAYFKAARAGLQKDGMQFVEMTGGHGMETKMKERRGIRMNDDKVIYTWDQKSFDPIQRNGHYAIHFALPSGETLKDAFTYDWRLWTIPEVREAMAEAGFRKTTVFWETSRRGEGTGEYVPMENGDNAYTWIAYVAGER